VLFGVRSANPRRSSYGTPRLAWFLRGTFGNDGGYVSSSRSSSTGCFGSRQGSVNRSPVARRQPGASPTDKWAAQKPGVSQSQTALSEAAAGGTRRPSSATAAKTCAVRIKPVGTSAPCWCGRCFDDLSRSGAGAHSSNTVDDGSAKLLQARAVAGRGRDVELRLRDNARSRPMAVRIPAGVIRRGDVSQEPAKIIQQPESVVGPGDPRFITRSRFEGERRRRHKRKSTRQHQKLENHPPSRLN